mgnify:CR=1 FL=1
MKISTTTVPYFKLDSGQFLTETMGMTDAAVGLYIRIMSLYWERQCSLPDDDELIIQLGIRTKQGRDNLALVINRFFKDRKHTKLDLCLEEVCKESKRQSDRAKKRWGESKTIDVSQDRSQHLIDDGDF